MNPDGTQDSNALNFYETSSGKNITQPQADGTGYTAAIKITSKCSFFSIAGQSWTGGSENVVDINNECNGVTVVCDDFQCRGKYALSAKTSRNVTFKGRISGKPSQWHVNLGSWSDQSGAVQDGTSLALTAEVLPIMVWIGNATPPQLDDASKYKLIGFGRYGPIVRKLVMLLWALGKKLHLA